MSFIGSVLTYLVNTVSSEIREGSPVSILPGNPNPIIQIHDKRGAIHAHHNNNSVWVTRLDKRNISTKQMNAFNSMNYTVKDIREFARSKAKLLAHLIAISMKESLSISYVFIAIDDSGKTYAYTNMPSHMISQGRWDGYHRKFICRLEPKDYRGHTNYLFNVKGWDVTPVEDYGSVSYPGVSLIETITHQVDINEAIRNRIEYMEQKQIEISKLTSQILGLQNDIEEIKKDISNVNIERATLIKAAEILGIYEGPEE
jgi:hypothetical protein